jgi:hypothetical protein
MKKLFLLVLFTSISFAQSIIKMNCGNGPITDEPTQWTNDKYYSGGGFYTSTAILPIGTSKIFQTVRYGPSFRYAIPVPNGKYTVILKFIEVLEGVTTRTFSVSINGITVLSNFNIYNEVGYNTPLDKIFNITAENLSGIQIVFTQGSRSAIIAGIEVYQQTTNDQENEWCPQPILERTNDTSFIIGKNWSEITPCYVHFNIVPPGSLDPIHIAKFTSPIIINLNTTTLSDQILIWFSAPTWTIPIIPVKLQIGITKIGLITNPAIIIQSPITLRIFPAQTVPLGFLDVANGILAPTTHAILNKHQIYVGNMPMVIRPFQGSYLFELNSTTQMALNLELSNAEKNLSLLKQKPYNQIQELQSRVQSLEFNTQKVHYLADTLYMDQKSQERTLSRIDILEMRMQNTIEDRKKLNDLIIQIQYYIQQLQNQIPETKLAKKD